MSVSRGGALPLRGVGNTADQRSRGAGSALCKQLPLCSEEGENPRSRPGTLLRFFQGRDCLSGAGGQGAWGLLVAYFRGRGGACAGRGCWGWGRVAFSLGLKAVQHVLGQPPEWGCLYIIVNETALAKLFSSGGRGALSFSIHFIKGKSQSSIPPLPPSPPTPPPHLPLKEGILVNELLPLLTPPPVHPILRLPGLGNIHFYGQS